MFKNERNMIDCERFGKGVSLEFLSLLKLPTFVFYNQQ